MSLSCDCEFDYSIVDWWYEGPTDYSLAPVLGRRKRCCSCGQLIHPRDIRVEFRRFRNPTEWEDWFLGWSAEGGEATLASWFMCEECGDLYFSLDELGFCVSLGDNMRELTREYAEVYHGN